MQNGKIQISWGSIPPISVVELHFLPELNSQTGVSELVPKRPNWFPGCYELVPGKKHFQFSFPFYTDLGLRLHIMQEWLKIVAFVTNVIKKNKK